MMIRYWIMVIVFSALACVSVFAGARGYGLGIKQTDKLTITVEGAAESPCYLGLTINGHDYPVRKVNQLIRETYSAPDVGFGLQITACLWEKKMTCPRDNQCEYCAKNGYHMDGRLAREEMTTDSLIDSMR